MTAPTLLLSDLHLPNCKSPLREKFLDFVNRRARGATAVYILGDLFEYWIGDDVGLADYAQEARALRALTDSGVRTYFLHGNRDFFIGAQFSEATGVVILPDPICIMLDGIPTLLSHGDLFCTDDVPYMRWRQFSRGPYRQRAFLALPRKLREHIAGSARRRSGEHKRNQRAAIMDVNDNAICAAFREYDVTHMIHGHTHRPGLSSYDIDGTQCQRVVLADWRTELQEILVSDGGGLRREPAAGPI